METEIIRTDGEQGLDRIYIAQAILKTFHGKENVEVQLFRSNASEQEKEALKPLNLVGEPAPDMPSELLAGATEDAALACLLEAFTYNEIEQLAAYLEKRYRDQIIKLTACPLELPVPLGIGPLGKVPESQSSGFINFDLAPEYSLAFRFKGFYDLNG